MPAAAPQAAADEPERMVRDFGFKGAVINGHSRGRYLDDKFFRPILERAQALGSMSRARAFFDQLPVSPADRKKIAHQNAELLMRF